MQTLLLIPYFLNKSPFLKGEAAFYFYLLLCFFEIGSQSVAQAGLTLPQSPQWVGFYIWLFLHSTHKQAECSAENPNLRIGS